MFSRFRQLSSKPSARAFSVALGSRGGARMALPRPGLTLAAHRRTLATGSDKLEAITQFGDLKLLGLENGTPVGLVQYLFEGYGYDKTLI